jgi:hypothetical protein
VVVTAGEYLNDVIVDHELHPAYEVHVGKVVEVDGVKTRLVSIWLEGARWSGYLAPVDPRTLPPPRPVNDAVVLYHEVAPEAWTTVCHRGIRRADRGDKTDQVTERADELLDERRPATIRDAGVSRRQVVYAYLSVDQDSLVDIDTGEVVTAHEYRAGRERCLVRIAADPSRCHVSDLDAYDRVVEAVQDGDDDAINEAVREYWSLVVPLSSYQHGQYRRPEVLLGDDVTPTQMQLVS